MLNWGGSLDVRRTKQKIDKISHQFVDNFEKNVYMPIASHPDIEFIIFFPPYSIARWLDIYRSGSLMQIINFNKYLITRLDTLKNCRSYYFQDLEEITHNLDNYRDQDHHHPKINSWIINQIAQGNCQVNGNTIDSYSNNLLKQVDLFIKDKE